MAELQVRCRRALRFRSGEWTDGASPTMFEKLTLKSVELRAVAVPLRRPVVSKVGLFRDWPLILVDLYTNEGVVGRSYLEPYLKDSARYIIPAIEDLGAALQGKPLAPLDVFHGNRRALNLIGYEG